MAAEATTAAPSNKLVWTGRIISGLIVLFLLFGSIYGIVNAAKLAPDSAKYGYPEGAMLKIQITLIVCALIYAFPRTSVLGAILLTGYLGGAVATHVRVSEPQFVVPIIVAVLAWAGIFLRDEKLRSLIPLRR
jgi:hypothetical protein